MSANSDKLAAFRKKHLRELLDTALDNMNAWGNTPKGSKEYREASYATHRAFTDLYVELDRLHPMDIFELRGIV